MIQAVILAGGKGVRLGKITKKIPKPMVKIGKLPILEHQINLLKKYGIKNIIILTGYFSNVIKNHFGSGNKFGVKIKYFGTEKRLGTAGRAKLAQKELKKDFILLYGDVMMNICLRGLINFHKKKKAFCTLTVQPSDHSYDADLIELDEEQRIVKIHSKPHAAEKYFQNLINAGACIISPKIFKCVKIKRNKEVDFCRDIFPKIIKREKLFGYFTPEYMQDAGTPARLRAVIKNHLSGKIKRLNLENKRSAIFIDRDGTINYDVHHLSDIRRFKIFPSTIKAIKLINS
ncbi:MAG: sugar phosphate nucleotidyltransferase, partial [Atribacterota bacterium]|nr:sugar phosphate nucleotidyltransferase [Atribacterota bacterium]